MGDGAPHPGGWRAVGNSAAGPRQLARGTAGDKVADLTRVYDAWLRASLRVRAAADHSSAFTGTLCHVEPANMAPMRELVLSRIAYMTATHQVRSAS